MNTSALRILIRYATEGIESRSDSEKAEIYDALAGVLPNPEDRMTAGRVAFAIRETAKLQMEFATLIQPPKQ